MTKRKRKKRTVKPSSAEQRLADFLAREETLRLYSTGLSKIEVCKVLGISERGLSKRCVKWKETDCTFHTLMLEARAAGRLITSEPEEVTPPPVKQPRNKEHVTLSNPWGHKPPVRRDEYGRVIPVKPLVDNGET